MPRPFRFLVALALASACGGGASITDLPEKAAPVDPYATIFVENTMTAAAGKLATTYVLNIVLDTGDVRIANLSSVGPGEQKCTSLSGFTTQRRLAVVAIADTSGGAAHLPDEYTSAALGLTSWPGMVTRTTGVFDPLVSADSTRGHTPEHPVRWRWTLTDSGPTFREDSTTGCVHLLANPGESH